MLKPDVYTTWKVFSDTTEFVVFPPITSEQRICQTFILQLLLSTLCLLPLDDQRPNVVASFLVVFCVRTITQRELKRERINTSEVYPESELRTQAESSLERLVIKSTVTAEHNFCTGISGLPELWLNTRFAHASAGRTRGLLKKKQQFHAIW